MDWQGTSDEASKTVELAVIKVEATVPVTDLTYGGAVVLNPGRCALRLTSRSETYEFLQAVQEAPVLGRYCEEAMQCEHFSPRVQIVITKQQK